MPIEILYGYCKIYKNIFQNGMQWMVDMAIDKDRLFFFKNLVA